MKNLAIILAISLVGGALLVGCSSGASDEDPTTKNMKPLEKKADHTAEGSAEAAGGSEVLQPQ